MSEFGEGLTYGDDAYYQSNYAWYAKVSAGYFYLRDVEYYLYAHKAVETIPSGSTTYTLTDQSDLSGPVVITTEPAGADPSGVDGNPFAQVTDTIGSKWHKVLTLTGVSREFTYDPDTAAIELSEIAPSGTSICYESKDDSYYYEMGKYDFNPQHAVAHNGLLYISEPSLDAYEIII
jgi:hypothetical protein